MALGEIEFQYYQTAMKDVLLENTGSYLEVRCRRVLWRVTVTYNIYIYVYE